MSDKMKFIIDMDIGDEIDDAIALYAAMRQNFEIIGITTVVRSPIAFCLFLCYNVDI